MEIIEKQIKALFKKKCAFSDHIGIQWKDLASKLNTVQKKIDWLNSFLKPLNLHVEITSNESPLKEKSDTT